LRKSNLAYPRKSVIPIEAEHEELTRQPVMTKNQFTEKKLLRHLSGIPNYFYYKHQ
jgi:hypothetical protein